jgi:hypothetical protein
VCNRRGGLFFFFFFFFFFFLAHIVQSWNTLMATMSKAQRTKPTSGSQRLVLFCIVVFSFLLLFSSVISTGKLGLPYQQTLIDYFVWSPRGKRQHSLSEKYLYWGNRIDCPGKNCETCAGLGHQESSLRCALEEAMFLNRTFVMPSGMCINPIHNKKGILNRSDNKTTEEGWVLLSAWLVCNLGGNV